MDTLKHFLTAIITPEYRWLYQILLILVATLLINFIIKKILDKITAKASLTQTFWNNVIVHAIGKPARLLISTTGIYIAYNLFISNYYQSLQNIFSGEKIYNTLVTISICWFIIRLIKSAEYSLIANPNKKRNYDETTLHAVGKLLRLIVIIIGSLTVMQTAGVSISGILAFGGVGGIAVGFAARDLLANFFGGLMIYLDRPFKVGDWVRSPDKSIEGTVEYIGWRQTRIRTFDKRPLYVPNAIFSNIVVENATRMSNRRIKETIGLRYQDGSQVDSILAAIKHYLATHQEIDSNCTLMVNFDRFGHSSLDFFIYCFTKTTNWVQFQDIKQEILLGILKIIHDHNADVAFPTTTLDIPKPIPVASQFNQTKRLGEFQPK